MFFNKDYNGYRKHVCSLTKIIMVITRKHVCSLTKIIMVIGSMYVL